MTNIPAKPRIYKGIVYRSTLEAKWALFFDEMAIEYQYEPGFFQVAMSGYSIGYRPDFALLNVNTQGDIPQPIYVEVKGVSAYAEISVNDRRRIEGFGKDHSLIVVGSIPTNTKYLFNGPDLLYNFFLITGKNMPCFFKKYNGKPWIVDQYRALQDCQETNDALWMACNAVFSDATTYNDADDIEPPF